MPNGREGQSRGPKGPQLEVKARRAPRLLVHRNIRFENYVWNYAGDERPKHGMLDEASQHLEHPLCFHKYLRVMTSHLQKVIGMTVTGFSMLKTQ